MTEPAPLYVVMAYRRGYTNAHQYLAFAGTDFAEVCRQAEAENAFRAGNYGFAVYHAPTSPDGTPELKAYYASTAGETRPRENKRLYVTHRLGQCVIQAVDSGQALLPQEEPALPLLAVKVDVPEWLRRERHRLAALYQCGKVAAEPHGQEASGGDG